MAVTIKNTKTELFFIVTRQDESLKFLKNLEIHIML